MSTPESTPLTGEEMLQLARDALERAAEVRALCQAWPGGGTLDAWRSYQLLAERTALDTMRLIGLLADELEARADADELLREAMHGVAGDDGPDFGPAER